jgi:hypothetical protein
MNTVVDRPQPAAEWQKNPDGQKEDALTETQQQLAAEEKARRAREHMESIRQLGIQKSRRAEGLCILCGSRISPLVRFVGAVRHRGCKSFSE